MIDHDTVCEITEIKDELSNNITRQINKLQDCNLTENKEILISFYQKIRQGIENTANDFLEDKITPEQDYIDTAGVFWLVWTPQGGHPKYKHSTRELAEMESARLAKQHPDREFYVLKCVSKAFAETRVNKVNYE